MDSGQRVRVAVADDSHIMREALTAMLGGQPELDLVAVCEDGDQLLAAVAEHHPAVVVTDIRMPPTGDREGLRVAACLRESDPDVGVVVLSQYVDSAYAMELMSRGTAGHAYLLKERVRDRAELLGAIDAVAHGGSAIDPTVVDALVESRTHEAGSPLARLTPRELQVLAEIAEGRSNAAIAASLDLTRHAVEKHVNAIFAKLELPEPDEVSRRVLAAITFLAAGGRLLPPAQL